MTSSGQFITVREASQVLGVSEKKIMDMIESKELQAYRIADQFLRLKRTDVQGLRSAGQVTNENVMYEYTFVQRFWDFVYYNDFYIIALVVILALVAVIFAK